MIRLRSTIAVAAVMLAAPVAAQSGWTELGSRDVSDRVDRDTIAVRGRQLYSQIALCAQQAPVRFFDLAVRYRSGRIQNIPVRALVRRGDCTRYLDLRGRNRDVAVVDFTYEAASLGRQRARVRLFAR